MRRALLLAAVVLPACSSGAAPIPTGDAGVCSLSAPALPSTHLHTDGTRLRDALGRVVILRGVNAGGRAKFAPYVPFDFAADGFLAASAAYLDRAAAWGINTLRVPFTWAAVEPVQGADDMTFLTRYDVLLQGAAQRGMFTIVDFHQDIYAEALCGDGFPDWTLPQPAPAPHHDCANWSTKYFNDPGVQAAFDAFWAPGSPVMAAYGALWDRLAGHFKDTPGVIGFEPLNEPGWGTASLDTFEATILTDFFTGMIPRLQHTAPDTLIFVDATGPDAGAQATGMGRPAGDGIVFAPHYYQLGALSGTVADAGKVKLDVTRWMNQARQWDVPLLLGEFGSSNATADTAAYLTAHFDALDALGASGTQWEYSAATELWNSEDLSLVRADGSESPMAAAIVRAYPRAVAGDDVAFAYDAATRGLTLAYTPIPGITEVAMPARLYPEGYDVVVTGGCADAGTAGRLLVQATAGAARVEVKVTAR
jgi:endoglycosylceramidase